MSTPESLNLTWVSIDCDETLSTFILAVAALAESAAKLALVNKELVWACIDAVVSPNTPKFVINEPVWVFIDDVETPILLNDVATVPVSAFTSPVIWTLEAVSCPPADTLNLDDDINDTGSAVFCDDESWKTLPADKLESPIENPPIVPPTSAVIEPSKITSPSSCKAKFDDDISKLPLLPLI